MYTGLMYYATSDQARSSAFSAYSPRLSSSPPPLLPPKRSVTIFPFTLSLLLVYARTEQLFLKRLNIRILIGRILTFNHRVKFLFTPTNQTFFIFLTFKSYFKFIDELIKLESNSDSYSYYLKLCKI